jgi:hypothetical protein
MHAWFKQQHCRRSGSAPRAAVPFPQLRSDYIAAGATAAAPSAESATPGRWRNGGPTDVSGSSASSSDVPRLTDGRTIRSRIWHGTWFAVSEGSKRSLISGSDTFNRLHPAPRSVSGPAKPQFGFCILTTSPRRQRQFGLSIRGQEGLPRTTLEPRDPENTGFGSSGGTEWAA